jgi:murein DD-endopeptidase MepM/ murein hydrolase activator NlpD
MPLPVLSGPPYIYHTIEPGETLGFLADWYGAAIEELVLMNQLAGPEAIIQVNQLLRVPIQVETFSPSHKLLPDSEVVYGPGYVGFDITAFVNEQGGYLASYEEYVEGEALSGGQIIERVAEQFSVGPRLLLALLEYYGQWVTNPTPNERQLHWPLGDRNPREGLFRGLEFTANRINAGYYGYKRDGFWIFRLPDRSQAITPVGLNAGTVGVQNILSLHADQAAWQQDLGPTGFLATYQALFGDPAALAIEPLIPITLRQPPLTLPWRSGQGFYLTGGPHPAFVDGSGWAAVDFGPPDVLGNCFYSAEPNTAAAAGVVVTAKQGEVQLDLDGDGQIQTGWVLFYLHVALDIDTPLQVGQRLQEGEVIGYASCEGGLSNSSHLHFARRYNGEWIAAAGPIPLEFSGWVTQPGLIPYAGGMTRAGESRTPCECWEADVNLIIR